MPNLPLHSMRFAKKNLKLYAPFVKLVYGSMFSNVFAKFTLWERYFTYAMKMLQYHRNDTVVADLFTAIAKKDPHVFVDCGADSWSYDYLDEYSNKIANYFNNANYRKGDIVVVYSDYQIECTALLLGLSKLGVVTAALNSQFQNDTLHRTIALVEPKAVICADEIYSHYNVIKHRLNSSIDLYKIHDASESVKSLTNCLENESEYPPEVINKPGLRDRLLVLFDRNSEIGPKAAFITNYSYIQMVLALKYLNTLSPETLHLLKIKYGIPTEIIQHYNQHEDKLQEILPKIFQEIVRGKIYC